MRGIVRILAFGALFSLGIAACAGADVSRIDSDVEQLKTRITSVEARLKRLEGDKPAAKAKSKGKAPAKAKTAKSKNGAEATKTKTTKTKTTTPAAP